MAEAGNPKPKIGFKCIKHGIGFTASKLPANLDGPALRFTTLVGDGGVAANLINHSFQRITVKRQ